MKLIKSFDFLGGTTNRKSLRLAVLSLFTALLTAKAFTQGGVGCNPTNFVPAYVVCPNAGEYYYATCSSSVWDATQGYSDCNVFSGCYPL